MAEELYKESVELRFLGYSVNQVYVSGINKWEVYVNVNGIPVDIDGKIIPAPPIGPKPFISKILIRSEDDELPWNKFNQIISQAAVEAKKAFRILREEFADESGPL